MTMTLSNKAIGPSYKKTCKKPYTYYKSYGLKYYHVNIQIIK